MSLAFSALDKLLADKKINYGEYIVSIDDIKQVLNISEIEYLEILDKSWTDSKKKVKSN